MSLLRGAQAVTSEEGLRENNPLDSGAAIIRILPERSNVWTEFENHSGNSLELAFVTWCGQMHSPSLS